MPSKTTPAKHKTPNYRLVTRTNPHPSWVPKRDRTFSTWEPAPLRADRKDLRPAA